MIRWIRHISNTSLGDDESPIVDQWTYLSVEIMKDCPWCTPKTKAIGNGWSQVDKTDVILTYPHDTAWLIICIPMNVIVIEARACRTSMERERVVRQTTETVQMAPAKKNARIIKYDDKYCIMNITWNVPTLRKWGRENVEILFGWNFSETRLPATLYRALWEKVFKGPARTRLDNVVKKIQKGFGADS